MKDFMRNKVVLITGGTSGIGLACATAFSHEGAKVIISARNQDRGEKVAFALNEKGGHVEFIKADMSNANDVSGLFGEIKEKYSWLDYAVNNAGIEGTPFVDTVNYEESVWDEVININLKGVWLCMKYELKIMLSQRCGSIVNVSSYAGIRASKTGGSAYTASKHGVVGLTKSAALEFADKNIRVNAVCPAIIQTPNAENVLGDRLEAVASDIHPMGRVGKASEVADVVRWLCSPQSSFVTGESIAIDGGLQA